MCPPSCCSAPRPKPVPTIDSFAVLALFFIMMRYLVGDYGKRVPFWDQTRRTTTTLLVIAGLDLLFVFLTGQSALWLRFSLMWVLLLLTIPLSREAAKHALSAAGLWRIPTLLISEGAHVQDVLRELDNSIALGFDVRHVVLIDDRCRTEPHRRPPGFRPHRSGRGVARGAAQPAAARRCWRWKICST